MLFSYLLRLFDVSLNLNIVFLKYLENLQIWESSRGLNLNIVFLKFNRNNKTSRRKNSLNLNIVFLKYTYQKVAERIYEV